jgi:hypothetical protein
MSSIGEWLTKPSANPYSIGFQWIIKQKIQSIPHSIQLIFIMLKKPRVIAVHPSIFLNPRPKTGRLNLKEIPILLRAYSYE